MFSKILILKSRLEWSLYELLIKVRGNHWNIWECIYLPQSIFSHGRLYVLCLELLWRKGLKILVTDEKCEYVNVTSNVVYKEIFQNVLYLLIYVSKLSIIILSLHNLLLLLFFAYIMWLLINITSYVNKEFTIGCQLI